MLLLCLFAALTLPMFLGFSSARFRTDWRSCRVLGLVGYELRLPAAPKHQRDLTGQPDFLRGYGPQYHKQNRRIRTTRGWIIL
ncbi:hypothetical protein [Hymenobacter metallicola]|uniref:Uncharacterized protein n=1 Tax=Hymenobacter metallicola TaxID=2563114 RepID=A0A4Z0QIK8_9BACT|nr:hypothetical protein [Hymenobacter metallicola]TGE29830.1 hypothetical protein E5K02_10325 [Hymenobacter metallicola]